VPEYKVVAHRRVQRFVKSLRDDNFRSAVINHIEKLGDYPLSLKEMDVEKIKGLEKTFRIRVGTYRIIFQVDTKEKVVYVTHVEARKKAYKKLE